MRWWQKAPKVPSERSMAIAGKRQQQLTKPQGSLGELERIAVLFAGWQNRDKPQIEKVHIRIFAGDHGVTAEGVSAFPQSVTVQMMQNFVSGGAAITVLARHCNANFSVINLGTAEPAPDVTGVVNVQLAPGTENFCIAPAMSDSIVLRAIDCGAAHVPVETDLFIGGEMGIGNSSSAAALTCALLDLSAEATVGRGTGIDDGTLAMKRDAVQRAVRLHAPTEISAFEALRRLGGLEIAALTGAYISCAQHGIPVVVDGYICTAAALVACRLNSGVRDWMLFAHASAEPGHQYLLRALAARPLVDFGLRLGEGSGAAIVVPLLQSACRLHNEMATFTEAGVSAGNAH